MLIVQRITTEWTKASRGGDGATHRNATPETLVVPPIVAADADYVLHDNRYPERQGFRHDFTLTQAATRPHVRLEPLFLHVTKTSVAARFIWSRRFCGAPERESQDLFRLSPGEWGRFSCNGRFGPESSSGGEWRYHKTVFNVAFLPRFDADVFIRVKPHVSAARLAMLA